MVEQLWRGESIDGGRPRQMFMSRSCRVRVLVGWIEVCVVAVSKANRGGGKENSRALHRCICEVIVEGLSMGRTVEWR